MSIDLFSAALGAGGVLAVAITTFGPTISKIWWAKYEAKNAHPGDSFEAAISKTHNVYAILNHAISSFGASRAMVLCTENNGGIPHVGSQLYMSIIYEQYLRGGHSVREDMQRLLIDDEYVRMIGLMQTSQKASVAMITDRMNKCMQKQMFDDAGTKLAFMYIVKASDKRLYFVSFEFNHQAWSDELEYHCDVEANRIRQIFASDDRA